MKRRLISKHIILMVPVLFMTFDTFAQSTPRARSARSSSAEAEKPKKASAKRAKSCKVAVQTNRDAAIEQAAAIDEVAPQVATRVTGVRIDSVEVPNSLGIIDKNADRLARHTESSQKVLQDLLDIDRDDFRGFQEKSDALMENVMKVEGLEDVLSSSHFTKIPLENLKVASETAEVLKGNLNEYVMKIQEINPKTNTILNPRAVSKFLSRISGGRIGDSIEARHKAYLEKVLTVADGIDATVDLIKNGPYGITKLREYIDHMKANRVDMLELEAKIEDKIAELIALDAVVLDYIVNNTTDTDPMRKFLVVEFLKVNRATIIDYKLISQELNTALIQNYANVQSNLNLVDRSIRAIPRLNLAMRNSAEGQAVATLQINNMTFLNNLDNATLGLGQESVSRMETAGALERGQQAHVDSLIKGYEAIAERVEKEVSAREAYAISSVQAMAPATKKLSDMLERSRSTVARVQAGESIRARLAGGDGSRNQDTTLAKGAKQLADQGEAIRGLTNVLTEARGVAKDVMGDLRRPAED